MFSIENIFYFPLKIYFFLVIFATVNLFFTTKKCLTQFSLPFAVATSVKYINLTLLERFSNKQTNKQTDPVCFGFASHRSVIGL